MDWDKLRIFHAAAAAGSFTHAGEALNMSQSAVSRQVGALERELNTPLFYRHARGLVLTEQGELLFRTAQDVSMKLASTEPGKFYGWVPLTVVVGMYFILVGFVLYSFQVFLPFLCEEFGWSRQSVSWANSFALSDCLTPGLYVGSPAKFIR